MNEQEFTIEWNIAREVIHLAYEYTNNNEALQWDFICNISNEDLLELEAYNLLQKYTKRKNTDNNLNWLQHIILIKKELRYREENNIIINDRD